MHVLIVDELGRVIREDLRLAQNARSHAWITLHGQAEARLTMWIEKLQFLPELAWPRLG